MKINRKQCMFDFIFEIAFGATFIVFIVIQKTPFGISFDFPVFI